MPYTAVVTGCAGFVGSELCKQLLARGFVVRGTVRNVAAPRSLELLAARTQAVPEGVISLVEADLLQPGAFDSAFEGADYIFHNASPFAIIVEDPQRDVRGAQSPCMAFCLLSVAYRILACTAARGVRVLGEDPVLIWLDLGSAPTRGA